MLSDDSQIDALNHLFWNCFGSGQPRQRISTADWSKMNYNFIMHFFRPALFLFLLYAMSLKAEMVGGGKGGPYLQYHGGELTKFDPEIAGTPMIIGGMGFGWASKTFKIGGGGGGGFLWSGSENAQFGIGYGGMIGEYMISDWLSFRLMIGGGGFSVSKITLETDSTIQFRRIMSGGFILFHPALVGEIKVSPWSSVGLCAGYFMPNIAKLHSFTLTIQLMFGRI